MRRLVTTLFGCLFAILGLVATASPVAAECTYIPPWPAVTDAIRSARSVIIGTVVTDFNVTDLGLTQGTSRHLALRVTEVVRGDYKVGELVDIEYLDPNWPWRGSPDTAPIPSCNGGPGRPGDVIALALDAVQPAQRLTDGSFSWWQPRTPYNAVGVAEVGPQGLKEREAVTLAEVRRLAALPQTDTLAEAPRGGAASPVILAFLAGLIGAAFAWRRAGSKRPARSG